MPTDMEETASLANDFLEMFLFKQERIPMLLTGTFIGAVLGAIELIIVGFFAWFTHKHPTTKKLTK